mmetsp:Transcript_83322/g.131852  ORF Transcript_83322/g.131852 Transcript_83322/m.131852 type:complete len:214 (+) Transcript_83322:1414-2055(+)
MWARRIALIHPILLGSRCHVSPAAAIPPSSHSTPDLGPEPPLAPRCTLRSPGFEGLVPPEYPRSHHKPPHRRIAKPWALGASIVSPPQADAPKILHDCAPKLVFEVAPKLPLPEQCLPKRHFLLCPEQKKIHWIHLSRLSQEKIGALVTGPRSASLSWWARLLRLATEPFVDVLLPQSPLQDRLLATCSIWIQRHGVQALQAVSTLAAKGEFH